jgi:hypothetical protein
MRPDGKFETYSSGNIYNTITSGGTGYSRLYFKRNGSYVGSIGSNASGLLNFTSGSSAAATGLSVNGTGIGVGIDAPIATIQAAGGASAANLYFTNTSAGNTTGDGLQLGFNSAGNLGYLWLYESGSVQFATANSERMRIDSTGNVGIGTVTPTATLQVSGSFTVSTSAQTTTPTLYAGTNGYVGVGTSSPAYALQIGAGTGINFAFSAAQAYQKIFNSSASIADTHLGQSAVLAGYPGIAFAQGGWGGSGMETYGAGIGLRASRSLGFYLGTGTSYAEGMTLTGTGLGIGTTAPQATLQVSGSFTVSTSAQTTTPTLYAGTNGYVGVGTNSPLYNVHVVNKDAASGSVLALQRHNTGGNAIVRFANASNAGIWELGIVSDSTNKFNIRDVGTSNSPFTIGQDTATNTFNIVKLVGASAVGGVAIGATATDAKLTVNGTISATALYVTSTGGVISGTMVFGNVASFTTLTVGGVAVTGAAGSADRISSSGDEAMVLAMPGGTVSFSTGGVAGTSYLDSTGRWIGPGISITTANGISSTNGYFTGNVGVGASAPNSKLEVAAANTTIANFPSLFVRTTDSPAADVGGGIGFGGIYAAGSAPTQWAGISGRKENGTDANTSGYLALSTRTNGSATAERMRITSVGNVGIGTITPTSALQVSGSFTVSTSAQTSSPTLYATTGGYVGIGTITPTTALEIAISGTTQHTTFIKLIDPQYSTYTKIGYSGYNVNGLQFKHVNGSREYGIDSQIYAGLRFYGGDLNRIGMVLNQDSKLGVGTTDPQATLQVSGSFTVSTSAQTTTPTLYAGTNGYVGVGTSSPAALLHLYNDGYGQRLTGGGFANYWSTEANPRMVADQNLLPNGNSAIGFNPGGASSIATAGTAVGLAASRQLGLYTSNGAALTERMRIDSSGNVGVSTSTPNAKLDVNGTISATALYVTSTGGVISGTMVFGNVASFTTLSVGGVAVTGGSSGSADRISSSGDEAMVLAMPGGTVSFTTGSVAGTSYLDSTGRWIGPGISITTANGISSTNGYFTGKIGVGTNAPNQALDVVGRIRAQDPVAPYSWLIDMFVDRTGGNISGTIQTGNTTTGLVLRTTEASAPIIFEPNSVERMRIASNGNVGIGTTAPAATLQVSGSFTVSTSAETTTPTLYAGTNGRVGIGTNAPTHALDVLISGVSGLIISNTTSGAVNASNLYISRGDEANGYAGIAFATGGANDWVLNVPAASRDLRLWSYGLNAEALRVANDTGYIGISTSTPNALLDVNGTISATAGIFATDITVNGNTYATSDRRMKTNIVPMHDGLAFLAKLRPVSYEMLAKPGVPSFGFIAQEVESAAPHLVHAGNDPSQTRSLNYTGIIAPTVQAVKELDGKVHALETANDNLSQTLNASIINLDTERKKREELGRVVDELRRELQTLKKSRSQ